MSSKQSDRREFLKRGAALAGGLGLAAAKPASGQLPDPEGMIVGTDDLVAYGKRSRFEDSKRIPHGGRHSPDAFGLDFHIAAPLQESVGSDHAVVAALRRNHPRLVRAGHRPRQASADDSRPGGPGTRVHHGGTAAISIGDPPAFHRMRGQSLQKQPHDRAGNPWHDELRRMDRRFAVHLARRGRRAGRRRVDRGGRASRK